MKIFKATQLLNMLYREIGGGQQKEAEAFCPHDKWCGLTGHFVCPH